MVLYDDNDVRMSRVDEMIKDDANKGMKENRMEVDVCCLWLGNG